MSLRYIKVTLPACYWSRPDDPLVWRFQMTAVSDKAAVAKTRQVGDIPTGSEIVASAHVI